MSRVPPGDPRRGKLSIICVGGVVEDRVWSRLVLYGGQMVGEGHGGRVQAGA